MVTNIIMYYIEIELISKSEKGVGVCMDLTKALTMCHYKLLHSNLGVKYDPFSPGFNNTEHMQQKYFVELLSYITIFE